MSKQELINDCDGIDALSLRISSRIDALKAQIKTIQSDGQRLVLLAQIDKMRMAQKEMDDAVTFIANHVHRHILNTNSSAA